MKIFLCVCVLLMLPPLFLAAAKVIPLADVFNPDAIAVSKNHVYITAYPNVYIYSLKDFKLLKKFGNKGEGPAEFNRFAVPYLQNDQVVFSDRNKVLYFSTNGDYIKEIKAKSMIHWGAAPISGGFVAQSRFNKDKTLYVTLNLYDAGINKIKDICMYPFFYQAEGGGKKCDAVELNGLKFQVFADKIYCKRGKDFIIDVFDQKGNKSYSIERDYKKIKISPADKTKYHDYFKTTNPWKRLYDSQIKNEIYFDDYFPAIQTFIVADDKIYVLTFERKQKLSHFVILDLKGKLLKEVYLPFDQSDEWFHYSLTKMVTQASPNPTFTIKGDMLYQLVENEETESWDLHITPI